MRPGPSATPRSVGVRGVFPVRADENGDVRELHLAVPGESLEASCIRPALHPA